jgi:hypothetical protein
MNKASILQHIFDAKKAHIRWVKRAKHLVEGLPIDKDFIPLKSTSCIFGKWLYSEGGNLRKVPHTNQLIEKIELEHDDLHNIYMRIYKIFFIVPNSKSLLQKILSFNSKKISPQDKEKAKMDVQHLQQISQRLLELLTKLEDEITALNDKELGSLVR